MVVDFRKYWKKKQYKDAGLDYEQEKKYVYSNPPPKRPSEIMEEEREREDYIRSVTETNEFHDYCQIETFGDRQAKRKKTVWDELARY